MQIGVCKIKLQLPVNQSLKGKRRVIKSLTDRIKNQYNVSICEIETLDQWQIATLGLAYVNSEPQQIEPTLQKILNFILMNEGDYLVLDHVQEVFSLK